MLRRRPDSPEASPASSAPAAAPQNFLRTPAPQPHKQLGDLLIEEGLVTAKQLEAALGEQREKGGFIGQILVRQGAVKQEAVASCLVKQCKIPHLSLLDYEVSPELLALIPQEVCRKYHLLPIDKLGRILTVAMVDPLDLDALEAVRQSCPDLRIKPILCNWEHFEHVSSKVFNEQLRKAGGAAETAESFGLISKPVSHAAPAPVAAPSAPAPLKLSDSALQQNNQLLESMRGALRDAMQESTQAAAAAPAAPGIDTAALTDAVRNSVQEALAAVVVQMRAQGQPVTGAGISDASIQQMADAVREAIGQVQHSQAERESRLTQLAEAMLASMQQTSQLMESRLVADGTAHDLRAASPPHRSVTSFKTMRGDNPPGEGDLKVLQAIESDIPLVALTFENYMPGNANAFTFRLSQAVAEKPGKEYNPYFLYGHVGVGKTHLISAIGNTILTKSKGARVGYVSASHFARRLAEAIQAKALDAFRENYCCWDVLILDDIQFLGGRVEAQEEFFHIFNVLHQQGRQIIIAGDKPPDRLGLLEQRLVSRFSSGIVAELKAPEWDTRVVILRRFCQDEKVTVPEGVLALIATRVPNDVRKMCGSLRKVVAFAKLVGQEMSVEMAGEILSHLGAEEAA